MKKVLLLTALAGFSFTSLFAADLQPAQNEKGKWGFTDASGAPIIDYKYDEVVPFDGKYAKVCKKDKWGFVDASGSEILKPSYQQITDFDDGVARISKDGKFGFINQDLEIIIPCTFSAVGSFNDRGLIWVQDGQKYGIYRKDGSTFIEPKYKTMGIFVPYEKVYDEEKYGKSSYTYKSHHRLNGSHHLFRKQRLDFTPFSKLPDNPIGYYYSTDQNGYKNSVVDPDGKVLIPHGKYYTPFYPTEGIAPVFISNNRYNFLDLTTEKFILPTNGVNGWAFFDGIAPVELKDGKKTYWQFVNKEGKPTSNARYDEIFPRVNNVYITLKDNKYGMVDINGNEIIAPSYSKIISTTGQFFGAQKNDNEPFGFIDNRGAWIIEPAYSSIGAFPNGFYTVQKNEKWGLMEGNGQMVFDCQWANLIPPSEPNPDLFWVTTDSGDDAKYQVYSRSRKKIAFNGKYAGVWNFNHHFPNVAFVHDGENKYGCINNEGKVIIPLEFSDFDVVSEAYNILKDRQSGIWRPIDTHRLRLTHEATNKSYRLSQKLENENWEY